MRSFGLVGLALVLLAGGGCTWVKPTRGSEAVRVAQPSEVDSCERLGYARSSVPDRVGILARGDSKVRGELITLARNEAATMGGDSIVAESPAVQGRQTFGVYRCSN